MQTIIYNRYMETLFTTVVFFAFMIEGAIENFFDSIPSWQSEYKHLIKRVAGILLGICVAFGFLLDAFTTMGINAIQPWVAQLVTGIVIGFGSQFMNSLMNKIR